MYIEDTTSKEQVLREIILWASEVKQKSIEIQTKYALEFSEELDKNIPRTCEAIAYSIISHQLGCKQIDRRMQGRRNLYEG